MTRAKNAVIILALGLALLWLGACSINTLPSKDVWYAQHYFLMQNFERDIYKRAAPEGRLEFQKLFWEARAQAAKAEFDGRLAYIMTAFKSENSRQPWNTDRARVFLLNGRPASVETRQNDSWAMTTAIGGGAASSGDRTNEDIGATTLEVWVYPYNKYIVYYAFTFSRPSSWKETQPPSGNSRYQGELEQLNKEETFGIADLEAYKAKLEALPKAK